MFMQLASRCLRQFPTCEKVPLFRSSHHDSTQVSGGSELRGGAANRSALAEATARAVGPEFVALLVLLAL